MPKICKKCGCERQEIENVSEYECPKCGAIYAKVDARLKHEAEELLRQKEQMEKERQAIIARHNEQEEKKRQKANSFQNDLLTCPNCGSMKPSGGVIAIGVLSIVLGVIGLILIPFQILVTFGGGSLTGASYLDFGILRAPIDLILEIILIISGIGVFMLKRWARTLALIYAWATIILAIIGLITVVPQIAKISPDAHSSFKAGMMGGLIGGAIALAYPIILLIFFSRRGVKEQFFEETRGTRRYKNDKGGRSGAD